MKENTTVEFGNRSVDRVETAKKILVNWNKDPKYFSGKQEREGGEN